MKDRSGGTPGTAENRDPNDEKVMATSPGNEPGRKVEASLDTLNNKSVNANSAISAYYEFGSSKTVAVENPYAKRMDALVTDLGNKDSVKG